MTRYLNGVHFPAKKEDLLRLARDNGAEEDVIEVIEALPDEQYQSVADIMKGYGEADNAPEDPRASPH